MPQQQAAAGHKFIVFNNFETMDTQNTRYDLARERLAWLENLQPIGRNRLQTVPAPLAALATLTGETVQKFFYANYNNTDYIIAFTASGAGYQVNASTGAFVKFANAGTFTNPDMTQWQSARILIADPTAGYSTWDGTAFVTAGGVSPVFTVTAGGSGYTGGATAAITGGSGGGATATVQVVGGVVVGLTLTAAGSGYKAGDTLTVTISAVSGGSGATATGKIWPILSIVPTTIAVFQGRVWLAGARQLFWTGTGGFDDSASADASGITTIPDADLVHQITALRALNNYLYIFGDNSIKQIGTITVSGSTTLFTIITLSSDQGTTFPLSILSYNRLIIFANKVGVYAVFGASVEKISNEMDGIFEAIDFSQPLQAALNDMANIRCYLLLVRYIDPRQGITRSLMLAFMNKRWFVVSQGNGVEAICSAPIAGALETFGSSGADVTQLLQSITTSVPFLIITALSGNGEPYTQKKTIRIGVAQSSVNPGTISATSDSENESLPTQYLVATPVKWINGAGAQVIWVNGSAAVITFTGSGFLWTRYQGDAAGITLGASLAGQFSGYTINAIVVEYEGRGDMFSKGSL
jgi:hypothetical protein